MEYYKLPQRILMINGNQLLNETFRKVTRKYKNIAIVGETKKVESVPNLILKQKPDWLFLIEQPEKEIPDEIRKAIDHSAKLKLIRLAVDGSKIELMNHTTAPRKVNVDNLNELVEIMIDSSSSLVELDHE